MELTRSTVERKAEEYAASEPLYEVERQHLDVLPDTFAGEEFGWRDAEWVVQWYFRRFLGAYPDERRREVEDSFRDNDFDDVVEILSAVANDEWDLGGKLDRLTALEGVDAPIASAFLAYSLPEQYAPVGEREWTVLHEADRLDQSYPDSLTAEEYAEYHEVCRALGGEFDAGPWTIYRALWRLWKEEYDH